MSLTSLAQSFDTEGNVHGFFFFFQSLLKRLLAKSIRTTLQIKTVVLNVHFMRKCWRSHPKTTPSRFDFLALFSCDGTFRLSCPISTLWLELQTSSERQRRHGYSTRCRVSRLQVCGTGNKNGRSLSGSILGTFSLSRANGVVHGGGASTAGCTLGGKTFRERGDWGGLRGGLMDRSHLRGSAELALGGGVNGTAERSPSSGVPRKHGARVCLVTPICLSR